MASLFAPGSPITKRERGRYALPALLFLLTLPVFLAIDGEIWNLLKEPEPFKEEKYPGTWNPETSFVFQPHAEIQTTNHLDYWTRQVSNAYGFADRDWSPVKPPGVLRVEFFGNSYVDALQVPIADKLQVRFEEAANRMFAPRKLETAAFANGGTGQANQLLYYDSKGRDFHPDVVVLVVNYTDFNYNSPLLASVLYGWHPDHLPRLFLRRTGPAGSFSASLPDPHWRDYRLSDNAASAPPATASARLHAWLLGNAGFYAWFIKTLQLHLPPSMQGWVDPHPLSDVYAARIAAIQRIPGYEQAFAGWNFPHDWDADSMFAAQRLPPVFEEAVAATGAALDAFLERGKRDGFRLLILTNVLVSANIHDARIEKETGNPGIEKGRFVRFKRLAEDRAIPVIDMLDYLERHGIDPAGTRWEHDSHWNAVGHQMAAAALVEAFQNHPAWLEPMAPAADPKPAR